jgi:hypothetical protein
MQEFEIPADIANMKVDVEIMLKDGSHRDSQGNLYIAATPWTKLETLPPETCEHLHTGCIDCVGDWASDHHISIVVDGDRYALTDVPGLEPFIP